MVHVHVQNERGLIDVVIKDSRFLDGPLEKGRGPLTGFGEKLFSAGMMCGIAREERKSFPRFELSKKDITTMADTASNPERNLIEPGTVDNLTNVVLGKGTGTGKRFAISPCATYG
jgi:hypothetical protein